MGRAEYDSYGYMTSYFPEIGEIVVYPNRRLGVALVVRARGVLYTGLHPNKGRVIMGVWDMCPATSDEIERFHEQRKFDLRDVMFDMRCTNKLPGGPIGRRFERYVVDTELEDSMDRGGEGRVLRDGSDYVVAG